MTDWPTEFAAEHGLRAPDRVTMPTCYGIRFALLEWLADRRGRADWIAVLITDAEEPGILVGAVPSVGPREALHTQLRLALKRAALWPSPLSSRRGVNRR